MIDRWMLLAAWCVTLSSVLYAWHCKRERDWWRRTSIRDTLELIKLREKLEKIEKDGTS